MSRILIVDDENMNLKMAEFILKTKYKDIILATSGGECLQVLETMPIDLLLLDIEMPDMSGIDTLRKIRENPRFSYLPVMFITASGDVNDVISAKNLNACGYIKKPFLPEILLEKVHSVIGPF